MKAKDFLVLVGVLFIFISGYLFDFKKEWEHVAYCFVLVGICIAAAGIVIRLEKL